MQRNFPQKRACRIHGRPEIIQSYKVRLSLRTSSNKRFTSFISFVFLEVLNETVCKVFCFYFPLRSVSVCVTRIKDACVNARKFCRNFKVEVRNRLCRSCFDISAQDSIDDTTGIFDGDTFSGTVPSCVNQVCFAPLFSIFLTALLHIL